MAQAATRKPGLHVHAVNRIATAEAVSFKLVIEREAIRIALHCQGRAPYIELPRKSDPKEA
jgi:hypothetical protein